MTVDTVPVLPTHRVAPAPVFIAGADRSGTTLMYALLASHPELSMVRRTNMWRYFHLRYGDLGDPRNLDRCLDAMTGYRRMRHLDPDEARIRREFAEGDPTYGRLFALFHEHHAELAGKTRWGDKSLHTEHYADRVLREYPAARIVQMVRDPRDRYASVRRRHGQELSRVGAATGRWLSSTRAGRRNQLRHPDRARFVRYEDLVADPATTMRGVCEFLGLEYDPEMLAMRGAPDHRDTGGNSSFGDVDVTSISTRAVGRYREVLSPSELTYIQVVARRDLEAMGYPRDPVTFPPGARLRCYAWDLPSQFVRMTGWSTAAWFRRRRGVPVSEPKHREAS